MANIYKYIQGEYGWKFVMFQDDRDDFSDPELEVKIIPYKARSTLKYLPIPLHPIKFKKYVIEQLKDFDIILGCDPTAYDQGILAAYACRKTGKPLVCDASITLMNQGQSLSWKLRRQMAHYALKRVNLIWLTSFKAAERFRDLGFNDKDIHGKFAILGHPVDLKEFYPADADSEKDGLTVLCVARLVLEKGIHYVVEAIAPLLKKNKRIKLKIVGEGPAKVFLRRIVKDNAVQNYVEFVGSLRHKELPKIYRTADVFIGHPISTSAWEEYFGLVNIEAMASGLPIISTRCGSLSYVIREEGVGLLVEERDIVGIRKALEELLFDKEKRVKMGLKAREYVEKCYSLPVIAENYKKHLENLTE